MTKTLIIGLGDPLMGDEGIGCYLADALSRDPRLPHHVAVIPGETDLLRLAEKMEGYDRIILIDAVLDPKSPGRIEIFEDDFSGLQDRQADAHQLSVVQAVELLRFSSPGLLSAQFLLVLVGVTNAKLSQRLSPALQAKLGEAVAKVLRLVREEVFE